MYGDGGSSDAIARDMSSLLHSSTFKHPSDGEFAMIKELISSDSSYSDYSHHDQGRQIKSSLMRYRSAPSSFYASLHDENGCDDFLAPVETSNHSPEEGRERFFSSDQHQQHVFQSDSHDFIEYASKIDTKEEGTPKVNHTQISTAMFGGNSHQMPHVPPSNSYIHHTNHNKMGSSSTLRTMNPTTSNLIRQSSSPAGFLSSLNAETGFAGMRDVEKPISSSRSNNHISFSSTPSSSPPFLPQIAESKNEINDSTFRSLKRTRNSDSMMFPSSITLDIENGSSGHYSPSLVHHMSLPKTSSEMATAEKFLRFEQDSIPCKIRAKRGCATHPRSIAERVRRTRISERMKKIQSLFPTMDKQTSTADMLDLAVQYIKDLQKELKTLNDARASCTCSTQQ